MLKPCAETKMMFNRQAVHVVKPYVQDKRYWTYVLTDTTTNVEVPEWSVRSTDLAIPRGFAIRKRTLHGGKQEGSTLIEIETDAISVVLIPTRGMSVLEAKAGDVELGWSSPVDEIVHPAFIDMQGRGGLGWLDGFNELMVRCGFEWSGHPCEDEGKLYTVHGRAGNTPASSVIVQVEKAQPHRIDIHGLVKEKTFKFADLEIWTCLSVVPGEARFEIHDRVTNRSDYERPYQVIYHTNFGPPLLEAGAHVLAPFAEVSPFNDRAASELEGWHSCATPTPGYDETVFNCTAHGTDSGATVAALVNSGETRGVAIRYSNLQLPAFTLWKNTDTLGQGYVTGLEPGTNPPYQRVIEREMGRIRRLAPKETVQCDLAVEALTSQDAVAELKQEVARIMGGRTTVLDPRQKRYRP